MKKSFILLVSGVYFGMAIPSYAVSNINELSDKILIRIALHLKKPEDDRSLKCVSKQFNRIVSKKLSILRDNANLEKAKKNVLKVDKYFSLLDFPEEILMSFLSFLEVEDLCTLACVSKALNLVTSDDSIWKRHIMDFEKDDSNPYKQQVKNERKNPVLFYIKNELEGCDVEFPYKDAKEKKIIYFRVEKGNTYKLRNTDFSKENKLLEGITSASIFFTQDGSSRKRMIPSPSTVSPPASYKITNTNLYLN